VDRIFINPAIKKAMCESVPANGDRSWLRKLRPWWGHDEHFHVRLACPADSPDCFVQAPMPDGDGCGAELESWLDRPTWPAPPEKPHHQSRPLPEACSGLAPKG
jgi:penicillin-insensitive murein endopeptidase